MKSGYGFQWIDRRRIKSMGLTSTFPFRRKDTDKSMKTTVFLSFEKEYLD